MRRWLLWLSIIGAASLTAPRWLDQDGDGYLRGRDCDDRDPRVHPGAIEHCDFVDEDCNGLIDDFAVDPGHWFLDADNDVHGGGLPLLACAAPAGWVATAGDCDDEDASVHPGQAERCDGRDEDCDGAIDNDATDATDWFLDADGDGSGAGAPIRSCDAPPDHVAHGGDCDDTDPTVYPWHDTCGPDLRPTTAFGIMAGWSRGPAHIPRITGWVCSSEATDPPLQLIGATSDDQTVLDVDLVFDRGDPWLDALRPIDCDGWHPFHMNVVDPLLPSTESLHVEVITQTGPTRLQVLDGPLAPPRSVLEGSLIANHDAWVHAAFTLPGQPASSTGWASSPVGLDPTTTAGLIEASIAPDLANGVDGIAMNVMYGSHPLWTSAELPVADHLAFWRSLGLSDAQVESRATDNLFALKRSGTDLVEVFHQALQSSDALRIASVRVNDKHHALYDPTTLVPADTSTWPSTRGFVGVTPFLASVRTEGALGCSSLDASYDLPDLWARTPDVRDHKTELVRELAALRPLGHTLDYIELDFTRSWCFWTPTQANRDVAFRSYLSQLSGAIRQASPGTGVLLRLPAHVFTSTGANRLVAEGVSLDELDNYADGVILSPHLGTYLTYDADLPIYRAAQPDLDLSLDIMNYAASAQLDGQTVYRPATPEARFSVARLARARGATFTSLFNSQYYSHHHRDDAGARLPTPVDQGRCLARPECVALQPLHQIRSTRILGGQGTAWQSEAFTVDLPSAPFGYEDGLLLLRIDDEDCPWNLSSQTVEVVVDNTVVAVADLDVPYPFDQGPDVNSTTAWFAEPAPGFALPASALTPGEHTLRVQGDGAGPSCSVRVPVVDVMAWPHAR